MLISANAVSADVSVDGINNEWGYFTYLYDNSNGLITSEANAVAQIDIGFIWIGGYSGLAVRQRAQFQFWGRDEGLTSLSVRALCEDGAGIFTFFPPLLCVCKR